VPSPTDAITATHAGRRAERRRTLVSAAADAIEVRGPGVGIDGIAEHCGLARPLLYRYFSGLGDLQAAILDHAATDLLDAMGQLGQKSLGEPDDVVYHAVHLYLHWVFRNPNLSRYCLQIAPAAGDLNGLRARIRQILAHLIVPLVFGHDDGGAEPNAFVAMLAGMAEGTAVWWLDADADVELVDLTVSLSRRIQAVVEAERTHRAQRDSPHPDPPLKPTTGRGIRP
jgi:AcrR family transcriptional regulator